MRCTHSVNAHRDPVRKGKLVNSFAVGDKVGWNTPNGLHTGTVLERRVDDFVLRQQVTASEAKPVYVVQSDTTGARAAHPPETLHRLAG